MYVLKGGHSNVRVNVSANVAFGMTQSLELGVCFNLRGSQWLVLRWPLFTGLRCPFAQGCAALLHGQRLTPQNERLTGFGNRQTTRAQRQTHHDLVS
jgi:hypothetical protein